MRHTKQYLFLFIFITACLLTLLVQAAEKKPRTDDALNSITLLAEETEEETETEDALNSITIKAETFKGDYDQMQKRRVIRFLVPYSKTFFFLDGATPRGLTYERIVAFEKMINQQPETKHIKIHAVVIPTARKDLIPNLINGTGDVATGNLTITEERLSDADFTAPFLTGVNELLVTHKLSKSYDSIFDLSGLKIHVRMSSSYRTSLEQVNKILAEFGVEPIIIVPVNDLLEDEDILEMVNAKFIDNTIIDQHKAEFWAKIFPDIFVQQQIKINTGGEIAWAIRKDSPLLKNRLDDFVSHNRAGTFSGNMLLRKYLKNTRYITNALQGNNKKRYDKVIKTFEKYGKQYKIDHFMLVALAYQESQLKQTAHSESGAVGIMQILPSTANDKNVNVPNINNVDGNIHAGTKYLRFIADRYFPASEQIDELNRVLFTFAAYNAGPQRVNKLRKIAAEKGYNPNIWFHNVEIIAAEKIGRETVQYVSNIFKYYIAYSLLNIANDKQHKNSPLRTFKIT